MRLLKCPKSPNSHKRFTVSAIEYTTWLVDKNGYWESTLESSDSDIGSDYSCADCDSLAIVEHI